MRSYTPFIENVSYADISVGFHYDPNPNSCLIQMVDPGMEFPLPRVKFDQVHQFQFLDDESGPGIIADEQAAQIAKILVECLDSQTNVIVHCVAGICRSGAVVDAGVMLGFRDAEKHRIPNWLVRSKIIRELGTLICEFT